jgi:hypothetical protein
MARSDVASGSGVRALEAPGLQVLRQLLHGADRLADLLCPHLPRREQIRAAGLGRVADAAFIDPGDNRVLAFEVVLCCRQHRVRRPQPFRLPIGAAVDHPLKDARPFGFELLAQVQVALFRRDGDGERDQVEPAPDCLVD